MQESLPASLPVLREALKDDDAEVRQSAALVLVRAGRETDTALPVLMDKLFVETDRFGDASRFQGRVVDQLARRGPTTPAVAAAWCEAWRTAKPKVRELLESGLLVLQPEALPQLLEQLKQAKAEQERRDLAHLLARFEGQNKLVLPILREELAMRNRSSVRAMQALKAWADAVEAVPELVKVLGHRNPGMPSRTDAGRIAVPRPP